MLRDFVQFTSVFLFAAELLLAARPTLAQAQNADPDSPQMQATARSALAHAKVLDIVGVTMGIDATLKDLGAKVTDREIHVELAADVLFDFDKFTLRPEANETLRKVGQVVAGYPDAPLLIEGYTDGKGTHDYNIKLSQNRAAAVKKWLVDNAQIKASRISTKGLGEA